MLLRSVAMSSERDGPSWPELHRDVLAFMRRRVSDPATAEDLSQDVFLRIQEKLGTLDDDARLYGWVYRIARNRLIDHYRSQRPGEALDGAAIAAELPDEPKRNNQLIGAWLRHTIHSLPEIYRDALQLAEIEGLSQVEVAERLGLSVPGAKSRVQRGRALLRKELSACCSVERDRRGNVLAFEKRGGGCC